MKNPIFTFELRRSMPVPAFEVAKLKFKREFEKSTIWQLIKKIVEWIAFHIPTNKWKI